MKFVNSFLFVVFAFLSLGLYGQSTVTVGTGTATDYNFPLQPYFNYGWSSQIYTAAEIGTSGTINSIAFYVNNSGSSYTLDNQKIYMRQTTSTQHADKFYPTTTGFTLVYSGSITIGASGWKTITLSTPFTYSNASNLEILVESRDGSTFTSAVQTRYTSKSDYRTKYDYNDYAFPSTWYAGGRVTKLPNIQFVINTCTTVAGTASASVSTICSGNTSALSLTGQTAGQAIQWQESTDNTTFTDISGATSTSYTTPSLTTNKYFRAKVGSGSCIVYSNVQTINVTALPSTPTLGNNGPLCAGSTLNLTASTLAGATYSWTGPNGFTSTSQNPTIANITTAGAGTYSVTATVNGCTSVVGTTSVAVNAIPSTPTLGNNGPLCSGSTLNLTASTLAGATYSWTGPNGFTSTSQNPTITNITTAGAGTYTISTTLNGCTSATSSTNVVVLLNTVGTLSSNKSNVCVGENISLTTIGQNVSANLVWEKSEDNQNYTVINGESNSILNVTNLSNSTSFRVRYNLTGCTQELSNTINIQVSNLQNTITSNKTEVCPGEKVLLTSNDLNANNTITWFSSLNGVDYSPILNSNSIFYNSNSLEQNTYFKSIKTDNICSKESNTILVTVTCSVKSNLISGEQTGILSIDLTSKPDKVGPFYYIVQEETVLPLSDILANTPQFLETATFNTKLDLVNIPEGQYNVVVYDSRGVALINDKVNFYAPIEFVDANTFTVNNNTVIANSTISSGSINQVITKETNSIVKYKIADPSKFNFVGFQDVNTGLNQLSDLKYGYSLQDNKLFAVENGNLIDLQIQAYPNMEFEIRQNSSDIELWHNNSLLRKFTNRYDDFTYNESFSLDQFGSIQHFGTGMEKICLECVPDINIKTSLNSCLEDNGTIEIELISNGATISSVKLFDSSNQLIQKDLSSKTLYYVYKNLVPGIYKVQYDYKYNYQRNYWLESSNRSVTRLINVDSKLNWNQYSNTIYSSNDESIKGKLGLINNFGSATSLNEARLDDKVYYIDFELNSFWARQNPSSKTILSWDDNVNPNSISNTDLLITRFENSYLNQFQIGSQKWNLNKIENDERPFEFNENGIRITYRYLYSYQFNSTNNTVSLIRKNLTNQTSKILIGPVTLSTNQQVRTIHFFTNYENTGLKNVKSNLNCKVISYVKLEREIKGMNYKPISNIIYFYYDE
jgi:hypothetical protein